MFLAGAASGPCKTMAFLTVFCLGSITLNGITPLSVLIIIAPQFGNSKRSHAPPENMPVVLIAVAAFSNLRGTNWVGNGLLDSGFGSGFGAGSGSLGSGFGSTLGSLLGLGSGSGID